MLEKVSDRGIRIYTVDIRNDYADGILENISAKTGGEYYYGEVVRDPMLLINSMICAMNGFAQEGLDSDGDRLLDEYEINGMKNINGQVIKTNPYCKDTDDDNLSDYEETGQVLDFSRYIGCGVFKNCCYIIYRSDPTDTDSDDDGIPDDKDPYPLKDNLQEVTVHNGYSGIEYLSIVSGSGEYTYPGGAQGWWKSFRTHESGANLYNDMNIRTAEMGCGTVAGSDLEIFLGQTYGFQSYPYNSSIKFPIWNNSGIIQRDDYMDYVDCNREYTYVLYDENFVPHGLLRENLCSGFSDYLAYNGILTEVTWGNSIDKDEVISYIIQMIDKNLPLVCAYATSDERCSINLYTDLYRAIKHDENPTLNDSFGINHHYMNIIGYVKVDNNKIDYDYYLVLETYATRYYVDYDLYAEQLSYSTNVLLYDI